MPFSLMGRLVVGASVVVLLALTAFANARDPAPAARPVVRAETPRPLRLVPENTEAVARARRNPAPRPEPSSTTATTPPSNRVERTNTGEFANYAVRPSSSDSPPGVTVYLHGICGNPANGCPHFRDGVTDRSWLVCPSAPVACPGGGVTWTAPRSQQRAAVQRAIDEAARLDPRGIDTSRPQVLIGFSQGAYVARDFLRSAPGRYRAVAFVGANIRISADRLRTAGVRRVLFAAGRRDVTRAGTARAARELQREGFPVRFLDLGNVGHTYVPGEGTPGWRDALAWLSGA